MTTQKILESYKDKVVYKSDNPEYLKFEPIDNDNTTHVIAAFHANWLNNFKTA